MFRLKRRPTKQRLVCALAVFGILSWAPAQEQPPTETQAQTEGDWTTLFDGSSLDGWTMAGPGGFNLLDDGSMLSEGGLGLLYYEEESFRDFVLELEWKVDDAETANSGVFVRFPETSDDPFYAVDNGYEIQIDDTDAPDRHTGSIYTFAAPTKLNSRPVGEWNRYRIRVTGQRYEVFLNGEKVNDFFGDRGREGYLGVQNHDPDSRVYFRNIRVRPVSDDAEIFETIGELFAARGATEAGSQAQGDRARVLMFTGAGGERDETATATLQAAQETMTDLSGKTEFEITVLGDARELSQETLADYDVLMFANTEGDIPLGSDQKAAISAFMRDGKGFVGTYSAAATNYRWPDYREMLGGGLFDPEAETALQSMELSIEAPEHPAVSAFAEAPAMTDLLPTLDINPRWTSKVLASVDTRSIGIAEGPADATSNDYPVAWCRYHNGGRVFYTALGGSAGMWQNPAFVDHLLGGMRVAAGSAEADCTGRRVKETVSDDVWPDDIAVDEQGNVWIAELRGKLHRYDAETGETVQIAQMETTDPTNIEHGVYGVEVDPNFYAGEPFVYVFYAEPVTFTNTLVKVPWQDGALVWDEQQVILRVPTEPQCCHQAGDLEWGPDGTLYISTGDTGFSEVQPEWELSQERIDAFVERNELDGYNWSRLADSERTSQNLQDLRGKVLRINKDGTIPHDNPFFGEPGVRWEIYAYGLRNPYRIKADPQTGCIYIGVVGPDEDVTYDEYNLVCEGGENFGWPRSGLGPLFYNEWSADDVPNYTPPLWEYSYETGGRSASGGPVYRLGELDAETAFPAAFHDKVFIYDWARRWIKWADVEEGRFTNIRTFDTLSDTAPISMELGPDGSLYVAEFTGFWDPAPGSKVTRYRWERGDDAPLAEAAALPFSGRAPLEVEFSSDGSYHPQGGEVAYAWDFGDGSSSNEPDPNHTYAEDGVYTATLVTSSGGLESEPRTLRVTVGNTAPTPEIASLAPGTLAEPSAPVRLAATASDPEDGDVAPENLAWTVTEIGLGGAEREVVSFTGAEGELPAAEEVDWNGAAQYRVRLTATDSEGLSETTEQLLRSTRLQAERYDRVAGFGFAEFEEDAQGVRAEAPGDFIGWTEVDLMGRGPAFLRVAPGPVSSTLELRAGGETGELLGSAVLSGTEGAWQTLEIPFEAPEEVTDLYLVAQTDGAVEDDQDAALGVQVDWLQVVGPGRPSARVQPVATEQEGAPAAEEEEAEAEEVEEEAAEAPAAMVNLEAGRTVFENNCTSCHAPDGEAVVGAYPPLRAHAAALYSAEGGRDYLANLLLYGVQGEIQVEGESYNGVMPGWQGLEDEQLADVLNYILSDWGNDEALEGDFSPYAPEDLAAQRDAGLSGQEVYESRPEVGDE